MSKTVEEYLSIVDTVFGIYLDSTAGFAQFSKMLESAQTDMSKKLGIEKSELHEKPFFYSKGDPTDKNTCILHTATQKEVLERNEETGLNYKAIANLCVVLIYQYWEDHYRALIAEERGLAKDALKVDIFGDLKNLRNSIIHHKEIETDGKYRILKWFNKGDEIKISKEQFEIIISNIRTTLHSEMSKLTQPRT